MSGRILRKIVRDERLPVSAGLAAAILLAWGYLLLGAGIEGMKGGKAMMPMRPEWSPGYAALVFVMWAVMMAAMMLPSAMPVTLLVVRVAGGRTGGRTVRTRLSCGLERLCGRGDGAAMAARYGGAAVARHGFRQCRDGRRRPRGGRPLSVDAAEGGVPQALSLAARFPAVPLARRRLRHARERRSARPLLSRLLLDADGIAVCRRRHEPRLGRGACPSRADREDAALGRAHEPHHRRGAPRLGRLDTGAGGGRDPAASGIRPGLDYRRGNVSVAMHRSLGPALACGLIAAVCGLSPQAAAATAQIARGKYLVTVIGCGDCHTPGALEGKPDTTRYLGGADVAFAVPGLGLFVPSNLTPDRETGLGNWTTGEIVTALTTGKRPDGRLLAPVMPWQDFSHLTPSDALAIAAYLKSLKPVRHAVPGPFRAHEKADVAVMTVLRAAVYNALPRPGAAANNAH